MWREAGAGEARRRKVQVFGFHSLRHTFVTLLRDSGMNREEIADLVGHGSPVMTARYDHSKTAARKAAGRLEGLG
jgi:integrase